MVRLFLARHGETLDNARRVMQGQTQGELSEKGRQQARELAESMAGENIDVFVSSDLKRAIDTCVIVAEPHGGEVITTPLLRERDWGGFTGRYIPDLKDAEWPDDIESLEALMDRASRFIDYLRGHYQSLTVLAVGHGIINKAIQAVYYGKDMREITPMTNAEVRTLLL